MENLTLERLIKLGPIIAATLSILAIITAISIAYFANWWRLRKSLAYVVKAYTGIFSIDPGIAEKIQVLYDGKPVMNARLFVIALLNDGRQPVEEKDFSSKSIDLVFSEGGQILSSEVINKNPHDLVVEKEERGNILSIKPLLLNKGDYFEIKGLINSDDEEITCNARIVGIKQVKRIQQSRPRSLSPTRVIALLLVLLLAFLFIVLGSDENKSIGLGLLVLVMGYWLSRNMRTQ